MAPSPVLPTMYNIAMYILGATPKIWREGFAL